jgi:hypothetical protein
VTWGEKFTEKLRFPEKSLIRQGKEPVCRIGTDRRLSWGTLLLYNQMQSKKRPYSLKTRSLEIEHAAENIGISCKAEANK